MIARYLRESPMAVLTLLLAAGIAGRAPAEPAFEEKPLGHWLEALENSDAAVRLEALQAIGKLGPEAERAAPALIAALGDDDPNVRAAAATALGALGPAAKSAVPSLLEALTDEGHTVAVEDGIPSYKPVWAVVSDALGDVGTAVLPELIAALENENPQVCLGAAGALHRIGPEAKEAVEPLLKLLKKDDDLTRRGAFYGLMGIGPEAMAAVPALTEALTHKDFHTQYWACRALREIGPEAKTAVPVLLGLLTEGAASVRRNAAQALGGIGPGIGEDAVGALAKALRDSSDPVREDAAIALGRLGPFAKSAAPALEEALANGPIAARVPAARALWLVTGRTERAVDVLIEELAELNWTYDAVQTLGEIGPAAKKAVPALVALLKLTDEEEDVREAAIDALKKIEPQAVPPEPRGIEENTRS